MVVHGSGPQRGLQCRSIGVVRALQGVHVLCTSDWNEIFPYPFITSTSEIPTLSYTQVEPPQIGYNREYP